jgi:hypothetical protein
MERSGGSVSTEPEIEIVDSGLAVRVEAVRALDEARLRAMDILADARHEAEVIRIEAGVLLDEARAERRAAEDVAAEAVAAAGLKARLIVAAARSEARITLEEALDELSPPDR